MPQSLRLHGLPWTLWPSVRPFVVVVVGGVVVVVASACLAGAIALGALLLAAKGASPQLLCLCAFSSLSPHGLALQGYGKPCLALLCLA